MSHAQRPALGSVAAGDEIGSMTVHVDRARRVEYAGASRDRNPIHWSQSMAESVGLPGVIAHGMLSMGTAVQLVTDWCGDPGAVIDYQTRFTAMVPVADTTAEGDGVPGARLEVTGKIGAIDLDAGTVRVDLAVTDPGQDGAKVLTKAQALVRLTPSGSDG